MWLINCQIPGESDDSDSFMTSTKGSLLHLWLGVESPDLRRPVGPALAVRTQPLPHSRCNIYGLSTCGVAFTFLHRVSRMLDDICHCGTVYVQKTILLASRERRAQELYVL